MQDIKECNRCTIPIEKQIWRLTKAFFNISFEHPLFLKLFPERFNSVCVQRVSPVLKAYRNSFHHNKYGSAAHHLPEVTKELTIGQITAMVC
ncbi:MAG: hypothetical protein QXQ46_00045 [Thermoplasmatales archaeon]